MTSPDRWERELRHSWPLLRARSSTEITTAPLPLTVGADPIRVGVDGTGARHLLVPVAPDDDVRGDDTEGALAIRVRTYTFAAVPLRYLDIACLRPDLADLFDEVLVDVLTSVATDGENPARTAVDVVGRWRALLSTRRGRLLTLVAQMALFAELTVLDLISRGGPVQASWWRGPLREPHDIVLPGRAVEVKAVGEHSSSIEIHGVHQLEPPGRPLALVLASVSESDTGTTLPYLVEHVLGRMDDRGEAIRLLAAVGYTRADSGRYSERFAVADVGLVEIDDEVPRIVPASFGPQGVPRGVGGIVYRIDLDALDALTLRGEAALTTWMEGAA